jgi:pilus assembly protein TadC
MSVSAQIRALSAVEDQIQTSNADAPTKSALTQSVQDIKDELRAYEKDKIFYRIVVGTLGLAILLVIVAVTILLLSKVTGFDTLTSIGSAAVGGLVGLLAPSPIGQT